MVRSMKEALFKSVQVVNTSSVRRASSGRAASRWQGARRDLAAATEAATVPPGEAKPLLEVQT